MLLLMPKKPIYAVVRASIMGQGLSRVLLYDGCRAAAVVRWPPEQQIWRKFIEAVEVMGPDKLIAGSGSG